MDNFEEESFRQTTARGIKQGGMKNSADKILEPFGKPVAANLTKIAKSIHPGAGIAEGAIDSFVKGLFLAGAAEVVGASSSILPKVPGLGSLDAEKVQGLGKWLRAYAGEQAGERTSNAAFALAPVLTGLMNNPNMKSVLDGIDVDGGDDDQPIPMAKERESLGQSLLDDDDDDED